MKRGTGCTAGYPRCGVDLPGREFDDVDHCARVMRPGDTCWIKDGTYTRGIDRANGRPYQPRRSGEPGRPISFRAHPGHRPLFKDGGIWDLGHSGRIHHITYAGLAVEGVLRIQGASEDERTRGVVVEGCDLWRGGGKNDGNWSAIFVQWAEDLVIRDNRIHHTEVDGAAKGISIFNGRRTLVEHNDIHDHPSEGIFDKEGGEGNVYRRNRFARNGVHLKINNQPDERGVWNVGTRIVENLFVCDEGRHTPVLMLARPTAWRVVSNTGYQCSGIHVRSRSGPAAAEAVYNNIWWRPEPGKTMWSSAHGDDREPLYMDHNLYAPGGVFRENRYAPDARTHPDLAAWRAAAHPRRYDAKSVVGDPRFADPAGGDFRLRADSPARGAGRDGEALGAWPRGDDEPIGPRPREAGTAAAGKVAPAAGR